MRLLRDAMAEMCQGEPRALDRRSRDVDAQNYLVVLQIQPEIAITFLSVALEP